MASLGVSARSMVENRKQKSYFLYILDNITIVIVRIQHPLHDLGTTVKHFASSSLCYLLHSEGHK